MADKDRDAETANRKGHMGPGAHAGGYGSQRYDVDHHGGSYGGHAGAGGGTSSDPGGCDAVMKGQQHMSGRHGDLAYGRLDGVTSNIPRDPTQHRMPLAASGGAQRPDAGQNAQIGSGAPSGPTAVGCENERDAPGISTDKRRDDT